MGDHSKSGYYFDNGKLYLTNYSLVNKKQAYEAARVLYFENRSSYYRTISRTIKAISI